MDSKTSFYNHTGVQKNASRKITEAFGNRVRDGRIKIGLSQEALALACELDRSYLGGVERGERNVSLINIYKLAAGLSVNTRDLF